MISKSVIRLLALLILALSVVANPTLVHGIPVLNNGTTPATEWVPSGAASDKIFYTFYSSDSSERTAICVGQPIGCTPSIDLTDVPLPGSDLQASGCVPTPTVPCAENDPRFWLTQATPQLGMFQLDFNHASTLWGVTFCNGRDNVIDGVTTCFDGVGGAPIIASCPNVPAPHTGDCSWAARNIRQGIESLINCAVFVIDDEDAIGPNALCMDNPTSPPTGALHSGAPNDGNNPCLPITPGTACGPGGTVTFCGGASCNTVSNYTVDSVTGQVVPGPVPPGQTDILGNPAYNLGGVCSWDAIIGCSKTPISAFHYYNDATDSSGTNIPPCGGAGQPACSGGGVNLGRDFCNAAAHFVAAGLATGTNNVCELTGESTQLTSPTYPVVFKCDASRGRQKLCQNLTQSICQLINLGNMACAPGLQFNLIIVNSDVAHSQVLRTGCKNGALDGGSCATKGPNTPANTVAQGGAYTQSWDMYTGAFFFPTPIPDTLWSLYDSVFASNYCGGSPGEESPNYDYVCNSTLDVWAAQSKFDPTPAAAMAALQVAQDVFGNHTFTSPLWTPVVQYPIAITGGTAIGSPGPGCPWVGVSNAVGIGPSNPWSLLNMWCQSPAITGPTIRWGQEEPTASLNPFTISSEVETNVINEIYDHLLVTNPFAPSQLIGWMVNFYRLETHLTQPAECPATYTNSRGTFTVGACVRFVLRGDSPWHDILTGASGSPCATASCLGYHVVTVSDVKFSFSAFNATNSPYTPGTENTIDIIGLNGTATGLAPQLPASAFSAVGGANGGGISESFVMLLHNNNAYALNEIATVPIIPQRLWTCQGNTTGTPCTNVHKMPNGFLQPCIALDTAACSADPVLLGGPQSDPVATDRLIGSGPFACSNQELTIVSGLVIGGGCTSSGTQSIPVGGNAVLRTFRKGANGLDSNFAYFRSNEKFLWFQWAAYSPATNGIAGQASVSDIISGVNSCKSSATAVGGVISYQACAHWNTVDAGLSCSLPATGDCDGVTAGGHGTLPGNPGPVLTQIQQWIGRGAWVFQPTTQLYSSLTQAQPIPQTLYADGSAEGSFSIAAAPTAVSVTNSTTANVAITVTLSGFPDNNFTAAPDKTVHQLNVTLTCVSPTGISCTLNSPSVALTLASPQAGVTATIDCSKPNGTYVAYVKASETGFPSVTVKITVTQT